MGQGLRLVDVGCTDPGKVRQHNEDSFVSRPEAGLWAVADGMGGFERGEWASATIAGALQGATLTRDFNQDTARIADAIHAAHRTIYAEATSTGRQMGSTVVALLIQDRRFAVFWVGDSRVYLLRQGILHRLTQDHTQVQAMVDAGLLSAEEARNHPMSHVLSRAAGVQPDLELEAFVDEAQVGDVFLLCSDGLHGVVSDAEIAERLAQRKPRAACDGLLELCLSRGAPDNVTMIAVACEEITLLSPAPQQAS